MVKSCILIRLWDLVTPKSCYGIMRWCEVFVLSLIVSLGAGSQDVPQHYLLHPPTGLHGNLDEGGQGTELYCTLGRCCGVLTR